MIARATPPRAPTLAPNPGTPAMVGNKRPQPHRFHLTDGRVLEGNLFRSPGSRLADHLSTLKGFISVTDAVCVTTGAPLSYLAVNQDHVLFIEEIHAFTEPAGPKLVTDPR